MTEELVALLRLVEQPHALFRSLHHHRHHASVGAGVGGRDPAPRPLHAVDSGEPVHVQRVRTVEPVQIGGISRAADGHVGSILGDEVELTVPAEHGLAVVLPLVLGGKGRLLGVGYGKKTKDAGLFHGGGMRLEKLVI